MAGMQDVAKRAGVGVGTVSRVINHSGYVSEATRSKVEQAIRELHYTPNELARNLFQNRTNIIAVMVPDSSNPFFAELVASIEKRLRQFGYKTMLCNTVSDQDTEQSYLDMLDRNMVDGILTATHSLHLRQYKAVHRPIVSFDTLYVPGQIPVVSANHTEGGAMAAEALLKCGCRHIIQFRDEENENENTFMARHKEFERIVVAQNVECINVYLRWNEFDIGYYDKLVEECMAAYPYADGIFGTDSIVMEYMKHLLLAGKRIPEDVHLVAYDGTVHVRSAYPLVTAIAQPIDGLVEAAVELLLRMINGETIQEDKVILPVELLHGMTAG